MVVHVVNLVELLVEIASWKMIASFEYDTDIEVKQRFVEVTLLQL